MKLYHLVVKLFTKWGIWKIIVNLDRLSLVVVKVVVVTRTVYHVPALGQVQCEVL